MENTYTIDCILSGNDFPLLYCGQVKAQMVPRTILCEHRCAAEMTHSSNWGQLLWSRQRKLVRLISWQLMTVSKWQYCP